MARYEKVGAIFRAAWKQFEKRSGGPQTKSGLAKALDMATPAAISLWMNGQRAPPTSRIEPIARYLFASDEPAQASFVRDIQAAMAECVEDPRDPFAAIIEDKRPIRWGIVRYGCFAQLRGAQDGGEGGGAAGFLVDLFQRFLAFAALPHIDDSKVEEIPFESIASDLEQGAVDIILGQMATVDRARLQYFFPTPIRIPLNAVYDANFLSWYGGVNRAHPGDLQSALGVQRSAQRRKFFPIIQEEEVGGLYVRRALGYKEQEYRSIPFGQHRAWAEALTQRNADELLPVAVVDEYTCAKIIDKMADGTGRFAFPLAGHDKVRTVAATEPQAQPQAQPHKEPRAETLPVYAVGITVNRQHRQWIEYLEEGLALFLAADTQYLAQQYVQLWVDLKAEFAETLVRTGRDAAEATERANCWANSVLGLEQEQDLDQIPPPWRPIVKQARKMINPPSGWRVAPGS